MKLQTELSSSDLDVVNSLKSPNGLTHDEAVNFVSLLHKLDRIRCASVAGYAWGLAQAPRHTVIQQETMKQLQEHLMAKS